MIDRDGVFPYLDKYLYVNDITLDPTIAKSIFKNKFPNIDLTGNDTNNYIITKYREAKNINKDKIINKESIFKMLDENGDQIYNIIEYKNDNMKLLINSL